MRKVFWIIPPCLTAASFWVGSLLVQSSKDRAAGIARDEEGAGKNKAFTARSEKQASFEEFAAAYQRDWSERLRQDQARLSGMSPAELRALILRRIAELSSNHGHELGDNDKRTQLMEAVKQLGRVDGENALEWVKANAPELKMQVMDGWADTDPAGAFQKIISGSSMNPCSGATIVKILQGFGDTNPADLKTACQKVPWEVFTNSPFEEGGFAVPPGASAGPGWRAGRLWS